MRAPASSRGDDLGGRLPTTPCPRGHPCWRRWHLDPGRPGQRPVGLTRHRPASSPKHARTTQARLREGQATRVTLDMRPKKSQRDRVTAVKTEVMGLMEPRGVPEPRSTELHTSRRHRLWPAHSASKHGAVPRRGLPPRGLQSGDPAQLAPPPGWTAPEQAGSLVRWSGTWATTPALGDGTG